jgi:hypothetical protein
MALGKAGSSLTAELNRLAGTTGLDAQGAANAWAGTDWSSNGRSIKH